MWACPHHMGSICDVSQHYFPRYARNLKGLRYKSPGLVVSLVVPRVATKVSDGGLSQPDLFAPSSKQCSPDCDILLHVLANDSNHRIGSRGAPGAHAAGVPREPDTVDCGVPPPPTPPGFAPLPNSPDFIAIRHFPSIQIIRIPGRIAILQLTDHHHVIHT